jgi:hypothetical protein
LEALETLNIDVLSLIAPWTPLIPISSLPYSKGEEKKQESKKEDD